MGEGLRVNIELLNAAVGRMLECKPHADVVNDLRSLLSAGMTPLREKLVPLGDEKLLNRVVEVWLFFFGTLLPYLLGVFEPLQMGRIDLSSQLEYGDSASSAFVRDLIIASFRKEVLASQLDRLRSAVDAFCSEPRPERRNVSTLLTLLQIVSLVAAPTRDDEQRKLDQLSATLKTTYMRWSRVLTSTQSQDLHA